MQCLHYSLEENNLSTNQNRGVKWRPLGEIEVTTRVCEMGEYECVLTATAME